MKLLLTVLVVLIAVPLFAKKNLTARWLNRDTVAKKIGFAGSEEKVTNNVAKREVNFATTTVNIRDLWAEKEAGDIRKKLVAKVPDRAVIMRRLTPAT